MTTLGRRRLLALGTLGLTLGFRAKPGIRDWRWGVDYGAATDPVCQRTADEGCEQGGHRSARGDEACGGGIPGPQQDEPGQRQPDRRVAEQRQ